jgi:hypothetical protein
MEPVQAFKLRYRVEAWANEPASPDPQYCGTAGLAHHRQVVGSNDLLFLGTAFVLPAAALVVLFVRRAQDDRVRLRWLSLLWLTPLCSVAWALGLTLTLFALALAQGRMSGETVAVAWVVSPLFGLFSASLLCPTSRLEGT